MGIVIRQSIKGSIVSYAGILLGAINMLFIFPFYLSPKDIGIIRLIESIALMIAAFGAVGVNQIADRFFPQFRAPEKKHQGYFTILLLINLIGFLLSSIVFLFFKDFWLGFYQEEASEVVNFYGEIVLFTFCIMFFNLLESYSRIHLRIVIPNLFRQLILRLVITVGIILYAYHWIDFYGLIIWRILSFGSMAIMIGIYIKILGVFFLTIDFNVFKKPVFKEMITYGLFMVIGGASSIIIVQIDSLMIGSLLKTEKLGVYTIAFFVGTIVEIPQKMFVQIISPILSQAWANKDLEQIHSIYKKSSVNQLIIGALIFIGIWASIDDLFSIMPNGESYRPGKYVVFFVGMTRIVTMVSGVNYQILIQSRYYKFNLTLAFLLAIFITLANLVFIPWFGITGAALATFISHILYNLSKIAFLWYKFKIQPFSYKILVIICITLTSYGFSQLLPEFPGVILNIIAKSLTISILFTSLILVFRVSEEYHQIALLVLQKIKAILKI